MQICCLQTDRGQCKVLHKIQDTVRTLLLGLYLSCFRNKSTSNIKSLSVTGTEVLECENPSLFLLYGLVFFYVLVCLYQ